MSYYSAQTVITGDVIKPPRTHKTANGAVCNFIVKVVAKWGKDEHQEFYRCVAFGELGAEIDSQIAAGLVVKVSGWMRSSDWTDGSGKQNHQLITREFEVVTEPKAEPVKATPRPTPTKQTSLIPNQPKQRRQYGRNVRKSKPVDDFRAVAGEPEFNDSLDGII